jgi:molybdopterin-containing oxidoreductase family iron-sulfur binding subunit
MLNAKIKSSLEDAMQKEVLTVVLTNTSASLYGSLLANLITKYPNAKHVVYDAVSESNALMLFNCLWC